MATYYVDPVSGCDLRDGLSAYEAKKNYRSLSLRPGDTVCFRRGSFMRDRLETTQGLPGQPITYTAYGEGARPVFCGSVDVSSPDLWEEVRPDVWRCLTPIDGEVGNFVFDDNCCTATLRWSSEELVGQGDFWDSRFGQLVHKKAIRPANQEILLWSAGNPGQFYKRIECLSSAFLNLCRAKDHIIVEDLAFKNNGLHGLTGSGRDVVIRKCDFLNIGGCVWSKELKIRYGNAVEFWTVGEDILVENCTFKNIYDSCVTHQGPGADTVPARNFICRKNLFDTYDMAAFEYRDKLPVNSFFTQNRCMNAGCGFAMLGEVLPRKSEIWPQPMGHHIFLWRIDQATDGGYLEITDNDFGPAPVGAAIYSIISPEAERQIRLDNNRYTAHSVLLNRFGGVNYSSLASYSFATGQDRNSTEQEYTDRQNDNA